MKNEPPFSWQHSDVGPPETADSDGSGNATSVCVLQMNAITKSFPGVNALAGVDFDLRPGEVHCLVGENGAGKSTLMRILTGAEIPDSGSIVIAGESFKAMSPSAGYRLGIGMIYQEADLVMTLTVAENIFLGHEMVNAHVFLDKPEMQKELEQLFSQLNMDFPLDTMVRTLGPAQRQLVQIAKALSRKIRILVLDEPTAALTDSEIGYLFDLLRGLRRQGIGMVYVSHRLNEIMELGDRVTVLRDGKHVFTKRVNTVTPDSLIAAMVGRQVDTNARRSSAKKSNIVLDVSELSVRGQFEHVSFTLHQGEILGIAGLIGAGRTEILECLFGLTRPDSGKVVLNGRQVKIAHPQDAVRLGLGLVPEERRESGLVLGRSVGENIAFPVLNRLSRLTLISSRRFADLATDIVKRLQIKTPGIHQLVRTLSGGNQQKVVIGKWLAAGTSILLLDEPTRGIDVNAKYEIYHLIRELVATGLSVVMVSSELSELLALSDRIMVMCEGRLVVTLDAGKTNQQDIMRHAIARPANISDGTAT